MRFYNDDIAIVEYSGILPDCDDEDTFFSQLLERRCSIKDLTQSDADNHLQVKFHLSPDKKSPDRTYSAHGTQISLDRIWKWAKQHELDNENMSAIEVIAHELIARMTRRNSQLFEGRRSECVVALSTGEPGTSRVIQKKVYSELKNSLPLSETEIERIDQYLKTTENHPTRNELLDKDFFFPLIFESVKSRFGISGPCSFIDAACASSVAATMIAVNRLRHNDCDIVVTGGIDIGLCMATLIGFSKVQVLSDKIMNPFDVSADGMNQGEAAALFAIMRIEDAKEVGFPIHAVIRNCDGSSDGVDGGQVEPTVRGQILAYENAYRDVPMHHLSYLECHGTGTSLGDKTEAASVAKYFQSTPPVGSVKANVGHTISAAGAVSLLKALKIIEKRIIPGLPNLKKSPEDWRLNISAENKKITETDTLRIGISSFGFGGANYHMVLDEYRGEKIFSYPKRKRPESFRFLRNASAEVDLKFVHELLSTSRIKVPPISLPYLDPAILGAILAVEKIFDQHTLRFDPLRREKIGVISASNFFTDKFQDCWWKVCWLEALRRFDKNPSHEKEKFIEDKTKGYLPFSEDTLTGALSNLIAGKVTKDFDLKGINFNVAAEKRSFPMALDYARSLLAYSSGAFFVLGFSEEINARKDRFNRGSVQAWLVSDEDFAQRAGLPVEYEISDIEHRAKEA